MRSESTCREKECPCPYRDEISQCQGSVRYRTVQFVALVHNTVNSIVTLSIFRWLLPHWIIQFVVAGPIIFAGWALGYKSAQVLQPVPPTHFFDTHLKCGLALLILYLIQLVLGLSAHFFKFRHQLHGHRAPHNYIHAAVGIAIFILAAYQARHFFLLESSTWL